MNIKEYIEIQLNIKKTSLESIYEELIRIGHSPKAIYETVNEVIEDNLKKLIEEYLNKKKGIK